MKVKTILVSQPEPKMENSPYSKLIDKEKVKVDFRPFIHVEGVDAHFLRNTMLYSGLPINFVRFDDFIKPYVDLR